MAEDGTVGPTIKLNSASWVDFQFHWMEWLTTSALGTDATLSGDIKGTYHIGDYPSSDGVVYLNPAISATAVDTGATVLWKHS